MARITTADLDLTSDPFEYEDDATGRVYVLADPGDISGDDLLNLEAMPLRDQIRAVLGDDADEFIKLGGRKINAVIAKWSEHYNVTALLGSLPEGAASPL